MKLNWQRLSPLPVALGQKHQPGVAGPFAGTHGEDLIMGGGANFMEAAPWRGGKKSIHDDLFVMRRSGSNYEWLPGTLKLPRPLAYGVSFNTSLGVVMAGGCDNERCYDEVILAKPTGNAEAPFELDTKTLPPLPMPLAFMSGAMVGDKLYIAGGQHAPGKKPTSLFCVLDLERMGDAERFQWQILPSWPGPVRLLPVSVACEGRFYLASGRIQESGKPTTVLTDFYVYDTRTELWEQLTDVHGFLRNGQDGWSVMAGTGAEIGGRLYFFGGARGTWFMELERIDFQIQALRDSLVSTVEGDDATQAQIDRLLQRKIEIQEDLHPGFSREILEYDPPKDAWRVSGELPQGSQVTTQAVKWGNDIIIPNGEVRPGIRTPDIWKIAVP